MIRRGTAITGIALLAAASFGVGTRSTIREDLEIRDAKGRLRVRIGAIDQGAFGIELLDEVGTARARFATEGEAVALLLIDGKGTEVVRAVVAEEGAGQVQLSSAGGATLRMTAASGKASISAFSSRDGKVPTATIGLDRDGGFCVIQEAQDSGARVALTAGAGGCRLGAWSTRNRRWACPCVSTRRVWITVEHR